MRILSTSLIVLAVSAWAGTAAWAQNNTNNTNGNGNTSTAEASHYVPDAFDSALSVSPRVGSFGYNAGNNVYENRIIEGIELNLGLASLFTPASNWQVGIESGVLYSHIGSPDGNFFGANSTSLATEGANMYVIPMTLLIGYRPSDTSLIGLNLGAQAVIRSIGTSMLLGRPGDSTTGNATDFFPSAGLTVGWDLTRQAAFSLRADAIPMPTVVGYDAMIGLTFGLV